MCIYGVYHFAVPLTNLVRRCGFSRKKRVDVPLWKQIVVWHVSKLGCCPSSVRSLAYSDLIGQASVASFVNRRLPNSVVHPCALPTVSDDGRLTNAVNWNPWLQTIPPRVQRQTPIQYGHPFQHYRIPTLYYFKWKLIVEFPTVIVLMEVTVIVEFPPDTVL